MYHLAMPPIRSTPRKFFHLFGRATFGMRLRASCFQAAETGLPMPAATRLLPPSEAVGGARVRDVCPSGASGGAPRYETLGSPDLRETRVQTSDRCGCLGAARSRDFWPFGAFVAPGYDPGALGYETFGLPEPSQTSQENFYKYRISLSK